MTGDEVPASPAGWYPDPWRLDPWRWWDGAEWTGWVSRSYRVSAGPRWFPRRGERSPGAGIRGGGIAAVGFVASLLVAVGAAFGADALGAPDEPVDVALLAGQAGLWMPLLAACVVAVHRHGTGTLADLGLRFQWRDTWIGVTAGVAARVASVVVVIPFVPLLEDERSRPNSFVESGTGGDTWAIVAVVLVVVIGAPFFEELFYRGLVQGILTRRWGAWTAIWVQAVLFSVLHVAPGMSTVQIAITLLTILVVGVFLAVLRYRFDRLGPGMVAHATFNAIALGVFFALD